MSRPFKWTEATCSRCNQKREMSSGMTMPADKKGFVHLLDHCPSCKIAPPIQYEPGVTFTFCNCQKLALPDWQPYQLAQLWNSTIQKKMITHGKFSETVANMPIRDWFAGMALQHIPPLLDANDENKSYAIIAEWSYKVADAMLAAREKDNEGQKENGKSLWDAAKLIDSLKNRIAELESKAHPTMACQKCGQMREMDHQCESEPAADGWIPHKEGCPIPCDAYAIVEVKWASGVTRRDIAIYFNWDLTGEHAITHWRPAK